MIRRLRAGDEGVLQALCRRFKERVPTDEENEAAERTYASAGASPTGENVLFTWRFTD